jgi:probable phosphoglycerate mutase
MGTRHLYVVRHGAADPFGELTSIGQRQAELLGQRLAGLPIDVVWHSPLVRAARSAEIIGGCLPGVAVREAAELVDHVPYVPPGFVDGDDGARIAEALIARFACPSDTEAHEVLVTHAYQVAWLVRHALDAPPARWRGLDCGNTALTVIEYRDGAAPVLVLYNDMGHLPPDLRWTGFGPGARP